MRKATIKRHTFCTEGTFGNYLSDSGFHCVTLERMKTGDHPCIPTGVYICELRHSPKHQHRDFGYNYGMVYGLKDVPSRKEIEIHPANWIFELKGCLAPGRKFMLMKPPTGPIQTGITDSRLTITELMRDMRGEPFELTISEEV